MKPTPPAFRRVHAPMSVALLMMMMTASWSGVARGGSDIDIDVILHAPVYEQRRHLHAPRHAGRRYHADGKSEYKYDDGVVKVEEKVDLRADKYEYKYEGPDGKCEEKYDRGKYEYKCE